MGNHSSKTEKKQLKKFNAHLAHYDKFLKVTNQFLGPIRLARNIERPEVMGIIKEMVFFSEEDAEKYYNLMQARKINNNFLSSPIVSCIERESGMCSSVIRVKFLCTCTEITLSDVIKNKKNQYGGVNAKGKEANTFPQLNDCDEFFSEPEIWYILDGLVNMVKQFMNLGLSHGFIQPETLYVDPDGHLTIPDIILFLNPNESLDEIDNRVDILELERMRITMAPEVLEMIRKEKPYKYDLHKAELWSIALTVLCVCVNGEMREFYDWEKKKINMKQIQFYFERMGEIGYSEELVSLLGQCLSENPAERPSINELTEFLLNLDSKMQESEAINIGGAFGDEESGRAAQIGGAFGGIPQQGHNPIPHTESQKMAEASLGYSQTAGVAIGGYHSSFQPSAPSYSFPQGTSHIPVSSQAHSSVHGQVVSSGSFGQTTQTPQLAISSSIPPEASVPSYLSYFQPSGGVHPPSNYENAGVTATFGVSTAGMAPVYHHNATTSANHSPLISSFI